MKIEKQIAAKKLRTEGKSIKDISKLLSVSKSSVSLWVRNINLSEEQKEKLLSKSKFTDNFSYKKKEDALFQFYYSFLTFN